MVNSKNPNEPAYSPKNWRMKVVWEGSLIHISATVDRAGLDRLRKKLDAMESLLGDEVNEVKTHD